MILIKEGQSALLSLQLSDAETNLFPVAKVIGTDKSKKLFPLKHTEHGLYLADVILPVGHYSVSYLTFKDTKFEKLSEKYSTITDDITVEQESHMDEKLNSLKDSLATEIYKIKQQVATQLQSKIDESLSKDMNLLKEFEAMSKKMETLHNETKQENEKLGNELKQENEKLSVGMDGVIKVAEPNTVIKEYLSNHMQKLVDNVLNGVDKKIEVIEEFQRLKEEALSMREQVSSLRREKAEFEKLTFESKDSFIKTAVKAKEMKLKLDAMTQEYFDSEVFVRKIPSNLLVTLRKSGDDIFMYFNGTEVIDFFPKIKKQFNDIPEDCEIEGYLTYNPYTVMALLKKYKSASTELFVTNTNVVGKLPFEKIEAVKVQTPDEMASKLLEEGLFEINANSKTYLFSRGQEEAINTYGAVLERIEPSIFMRPVAITQEEFNTFFENEESLALAVEDSISGPEVLFIKDGDNVIIREDFKDVTRNYTELASKMGNLDVDCGVFRGTIVGFINDTKVSQGVIFTDMLYYDGFNLCNEIYENRRKLLDKIGEDNKLFEDESLIKIGELAIANDFETLKKAINSFEKEVLIKPMNNRFSLIDKSNNAIISFARSD